MNRYRRHLPVILILLIARDAFGATALAVEVGWEGRFSVGRWTPLFITVSDDRPRAIELEIRAPHAGAGMLIRQHLSVTPTPATYAVYLPMPWNLNEVSVVARDARTARRIAEWPDDQLRARFAAEQSSVEVLIGTSGRAPALRGFPGAFSHRQVEVAHLPVERLPVTPIGYDAFDVLVLNQPDLSRITFEQQQAMVDWVRGGGVLLLWPGDEPWPITSPLAATVPCVVGDNILLELDPAALEATGLPARFGRLGARTLAGKPGARRIETLNTPAAAAWCDDVGLGQIVVLPFDPSQFTFVDDADLRQFWRAYLDRAVDPNAWETSPKFRVWIGQQSQQHATAVNAVGEMMIADIPGVGRFAFGYTAAVLLGLTLIVGPVDWFLLRYLGRQPWTWTTTTGCIAAVTLAALMIGHIFRSGDLHLRTLRVVDQASGQTLATADVAFVYSTQTRSYDFEVDADSYWQPGSAVTHIGSRSLAMDVPFAQDARGNRPMRSVINAGNLRLLAGDSRAPAPAVVQAELTVVGTVAGNSHSAARIVGTITNLSDTGLSDVIIRTGAGAAHLHEMLIPPGGTVTVDHPLAYDAAMFASDQFQYPGQPGRRQPDVRYPPTCTPQYWFHADLAAGRSRRIDSILTDRSDVACIYAEGVDPVAVMGMAPDPPIGRHRRIVRALVPISTDGP